MLCFGKQTDKLELKNHIIFSVFITCGGIIYEEDTIHFDGVYNALGIDTVGRGNPRVC